MYNKGLVMCIDHYKCEHESCVHHDWHKKKGTCKPRVCDKSEENVSCTATPRPKPETTSE